MEERDNILNDSINTEMNQSLPLTEDAAHAMPSVSLEKPSEETAQTAMQNPTIPPEPLAQQSMQSETIPPSPVSPLPVQNEPIQQISAQPQNLQGNTIPPFPVNSQGMQNNTVPPRPVAPQGMQNNTVPPRPVNPQGMQNNAVPPRPVDSQGMQNNTVPPRPVNPQGMQNNVVSPMNNINGSGQFISADRPTIPKPPEYTSAPRINPQQPQTPPPPVQNTGARRPVYDKFMYEPIGFEGYDRRAHIPPEPPVNDNMMNSYSQPMQPSEVKSDKLAYRMLAVLVAFCAIISVFGIVYDVANSKKALGKAVQGGNVVIYSEKKPDSAKDAEDYKNEDGKFSTEGVAKLVRPSIVEIYLYSDAAHTDLVGTGSGVVISKDGYIVTNAHVLDSDGHQSVKTLDGKTYNARIIGRDSKTDIAVIKVDGSELTPAVLGDSDEAVVGEQVVAIGNPANLTSTVTDGIISAINRKIRSDSTSFQMDCIQTNADISPGNSGGALVNMYGQVIGITSSKYVSSNIEGLGFAIAINEAKPIIEELINNGYIGGRFKIGIRLIDMSTASKREQIQEAIKTDIPENFKGIYIAEIDKDCDIANTKLKAGDFITEIDETPISTYDELYDTISSKYGAGDTVPATCAHIEKGMVSYYDIKFKLMEDTSGNY